MARVRVQALCVGLVCGVLMAISQYPSPIFVSLMVLGPAVLKLEFL